MLFTYDVTVVGAGASGMICALKLAERGKRVLLLEKLDKVGKKILASGNGRCNFTNKTIYKDSYNHDMEIYLDKFSNQDIVEYFNHLGILSYYDSEGRAYPISNHSASVVDVLKQRLLSTNVDLVVSEGIVSMECPVPHFYILNSARNRYCCNFVVMCVGGEAGRDLLKDFDLEYEDQMTSLCGIITQKVGDINGVRQSNVLVSAKFRDHVFSERGEVMFKQQGLSGIVIFNLSSFLSRLKAKSSTISLDLLPDYTQQEVESILYHRKRLRANEFTFLDGIFHKDLNKVIIERTLKKLHIKKFDLQNKDLVWQMANIIKNMEFKFCGFMDNNQITRGGIKLSCVDDNLQALNYPGLYFCGEMLDVDGRCGGYNLQWAWTSGVIVGDNLC